MNNEDYARLISGIVIGLLLSFAIIYIGVALDIPLIDSADAAPKMILDDVKRVDCDFSYYWNRSGYPVKNVECELVR